MVKYCNEDKDPLRVVPYAQGFHFYTDVGNPCGVTSTSLDEFATSLQYVCSKAIVFHFERGDFQNWIRDIIGDSELCQKIDDIKLCSRYKSSDSCRNELVDAVRIRILQLEVERSAYCFGKQRGKNTL